MSGKTVIIGGIILIVFIVVIMAIFRYGMSQQTNPSQQNSGTSYAIGDINQDGTVDAVDENFITTHIGCKKTDKCWNEVIGKTLSGDNPIYTSDLDLDHNGVIDQGDINMLKSVEKR